MLKTFKPEREGEAKCCINQRWWLALTQSEVETVLSSQFCLRNVKAWRMKTREDGSKINSLFNKLLKEKPKQLNTWKYYVKAFIIVDFIGKICISCIMHQTKHNINIYLFNDFTFSSLLLIMIILFCEHFILHQPLESFQCSEDIAAMPVLVLLCWVLVHTVHQHLGRERHQIVMIGTLPNSFKYPNCYYCPTGFWEKNTQIMPRLNFSMNQFTPYQNTTLFPNPAYILYESIHTLSIRNQVYILFFFSIFCNYGLMSFLRPCALYKTPITFPMPH